MLMFFAVLHEMRWALKALLSLSCFFFFFYFLEVVSSILTKEFSLSLLLLLLPSLEEVVLMFFAVLHEMDIEGASFSLFYPLLSEGGVNVIYKGVFLDPFPSHL